MNKVFFSHKSDEWSTPQSLFDSLNNVFHFTLDCCACSDNAKVSHYFSKHDNGLLQSWSNEIVWCNPPYSSISSWVDKAVSERVPCVMLVPARVDTRWFHDLVYGKFRFEFIRGRLKFSNSRYSAPFPSMLIYFYC